MTVVKCSLANQGNEPNVVTEIVRFLRYHFYAFLVEYLGSINETSTFQKPSAMCCLSKYRLNNSSKIIVIKIEFFYIRDQKVTESVWKMSFILNIKISTRHTHFV